MNRPKQSAINKMRMLIPPTGGTMTISEVQRQCHNSLPFEEKKKTCPSIVNFERCLLNVLNLLNKVQLSI